MANEWTLKGSYFETCNCEAACPCNFLSPPTEGHCTVLVGWHIDQGTYRGTRLDGLNVAMVVHSPGHMMKTKWRVALYLDDRANGDQQKGLTQIFSGQAGGLMERLSGFVGEVAGIRSVPIEYRAEGRARGIRVGDVGVADIEAIAGDEAGEEVTIANAPFSLAPGAALVAARSKRYRYRDFGMAMEATNRNGFYAPFSYSPG